MEVFEELFCESQGRPVVYRGKTVMLGDRLNVGVGTSHLMFRIVSTSSEWRQGFTLDCNGVLDFGDGEEVSSGVHIWSDTAPSEAMFRCRPKDGILRVWNIWDTGNGCAESGHHGAAMWAEQIPGGWRYHCNDGHPDDDFNDIVFEILILSRTRIGT